jgi:mono/diheme cytochrome c family protein
MSLSHRARLAPSLLAIVLLVGACGVTQSGPAIQGDATRGRNLWVQSACAGCHGVGAQGSMRGPGLANTPLTIREVISITRRGGPGMPGYSATQISDQDLQDLYAWFQNPVPVATGELEQEPWTEAGCGGCHGANAEGGFAPGLTGKEYSYDAFQQVVRAGEEGMPAYSASQISDTDLQQMYGWLQAKAQVPPGTAELEEDPWTQSGCGGCHGANAEGGSAPVLAGRQYSYDDFQQVVRQGAEGMPAYSSSELGDRDLQCMYGWLQAQVQVPAGTAELVQDPWTQSGCSGCHGANAEGGSAPVLAGRQYSYDEFLQVVRQGAEGMPAYSSGQISDTELRQLYDWLRAIP